MAAGLNDVLASMPRTVKLSVYVGLPLLFALPVYMYLAPYKRAITIEADTLSVTIQFTGVENKWALKGDFLLCKRIQGTPRELRVLMETRGRQDSQLLSECGDGPFTSTPLTDEVIDWPKGSTIKFSLDSGPYPFKIRYFGSAGPDRDQESIDSDIPLESFYLLSSDSIAQSGLARYTGYVKIGDVPSSGSNDHLLAGKYEVWDVPRFNRPAMKTLSGPLLLGDAASVVQNSSCSGKCDVVSEIIIAFNEQDNSMRAVLHSGIKDDRLQVDRFGGNRAYFASNWFDRAKNDSILIAMSSILALAAVLAGVLDFASRCAAFLRNNQ